MENDPKKNGVTDMTEVPASAPIGSKPPTYATDGLIGDAYSTAENLEDVLPNPGEKDAEDE